MKFNSIRRSTRFVLGTAALALSLAGCGDDEGQTNAPPSNQPTYDLNAPYGGLTATDEQPAFGDAGLAAMEEEEAPVSDPLNDQVGSHGRGRATYAFTAIWGKLQDPERNDSGQLGDEDGDATNWTGKIELSSGAVHVRRTIAFERRDFLRPRRDPSMLEWVSFTGERYDGLRLSIMSDDADSAGMGTLTFETPAFTRTFTMNELADLDLLVDVDLNGNQVRIRSVATHPNETVRGLVVGRWHQAPDSEVGNFGGRWIAPDGAALGHVQGIFGLNDAGQRVFHGKWINRGGRFEGFVSGTWAVSESHGVAGESGTLDGKIFGGQEQTPVELGKLQGQWVKGDNGRGMFDGVWCLGCP